MVATIGLLGPLANMGVEMDNRTERFAPKDDRSFIHLAEMQAQFGRDDTFTALVNGDVFSVEFLNRLKELHEGLENLSPEEKQATSLWSTPLLIDRNGVKQPMRLKYALEKGVQTNLIQMGAAPYENQLVSQSGKWTAIYLQTPMMTPTESSDFAEQMTKLVKEHDQDGFRTLTGGIPTFVAKLDGLTQVESNRLGGLSMALMLIMLTIQFRRASMILGPLIVMIMGIVWTFGIMALSGLKLSYMTSILPGFLISVCVGDAIHIQALVQSDLKRGVGLKEAIASAMNHAWMPMLFTTLTTAIGLFSFQFSTLPAVSELGLFGAIGVIIAFALSVCIIPICLSFARTEKTNTTQSIQPLNGFLRACLRWSHPKIGRKALFASSLLIGCAIYGASTLQISHNPLAWLPPKGDIKQSMDTMDQELGGASEFSLYLKSSDTNHLLNPKKLQAMHRIEQKLLKHKTEKHGVQVQTALSVLDALRFSLLASQSTLQFDDLIKDDQKLDLWLKNLEQVNPKWHDGIFSADLTETRMQFRLHWQPAEKMLDLKAFIVEEAKTMNSDGIEAHPVGTLFNLISTFGVLVQDLLNSFGMAVVVILILMTMALKSIKLGLIAILPNLAPIIFTMGSMALLDIPFDMSTVLFASIILGICVDDTIHFLHHFKEKYNTDGNVDQAIEAALRYGGHAILITSLLLAGCLGIYLMSDMLNLQRFGLLMMLSVSFAVLADLILLPMLLKLCIKDRPIDDFKGESKKMTVAD